MTSDPAAEWVRRDAAVVWHGFTQMACYAENQPIVVERAEGRHLIDVAGRRYLDAISSLWVTTLGHRVPELDGALGEQLSKVAHSTLLGNGGRTVVELAEALAAVVPVERPHFLFASDGASAVEQALKIAFQHWRNLGVKGRTAYLALGDAYHGDTVGALSLGDDGFGSTAFDGLRFPVLRAPGYGCPDWAERAAGLVHGHGPSLAAVVLEPLVQAAGGGMRVADPGAFGVLAAACQKTGVLLVCDEIATGFGRTGSLFASSRCGLRPDLMTLGKGLTGGYLPMSATVAAGHVYESFLGPDLGERTFYHGHSYGGNALAAAVALRHLRLLAEGDVLGNVRARSAQLGALLEDRVAVLPGVREVRLEGLMGGVELVAAPGQRRGRRVCAAAVRRGVLLRPLGDVVVLMPPLTITGDEVAELVEALRGAIEEVTAA